MPLHLPLHDTLEALEATYKAQRSSSDLRWAREVVRKTNLLDFFPVRLKKSKIAEKDVSAVCDGIDVDEIISNMLQAEGGRGAFRQDGWYCSDCLYKFLGSRFFVFFARRYAQSPSRCSKAAGNEKAY